MLTNLTGLFLIAAGWYCLLAQENGENAITLFVGALILFAITHEGRR